MMTDEQRANSLALLKCLANRNLGSTTYLKECLDNENWDMAGVAVADLHVIDQLLVVGYTILGAGRVQNLGTTPVMRQAAADRLNAEYNHEMGKRGFAFPSQEQLESIIPYPDEGTPLSGILSRVLDEQQRRDDGS